MAQNIEIKARVADFTEIQKKAAQLSSTAPALLNQEDTFFKIPEGRLKLRILAPNDGELIFYERPDQAGPKTSYYLISKTTAPETLKAVLTAALEIRGTVKKQRWLYLTGNTRIHLDKVEGLGTFLELEVVMQPGQPIEQGEQTARSLINYLGIQHHDLIDGAYIDLLERQNNPST